MAVVSRQYNKLSGGLLSLTCEAETHRNCQLEECCEWEAERKSGDWAGGAGGGYLGFTALLTLGEWKLLTPEEAFRASSPVWYTVSLCDLTCWVQSGGAPSKWFGFRIWHVRLRTHAVLADNPFLIPSITIFLSFLQHYPEFSGSAEAMHLTNALQGTLHRHTNTPTNANILFLDNL